MEAFFVMYFRRHVLVIKHKRATPMVTYIVLCVTECENWESFSFSLVGRDNLVFDIFGFVVVIFRCC